MRIAGVLFDFDGVVVDSLSVHISAWEMAVQELFGSQIASARRLAGRSTMAIAQILASENKRPDLASSLADRKRQILTQQGNAVPLLPGFREFAAHLSAHHRPWGIASNAPREFIRKTLAHHGIDARFVFGIDDVQRGKPAPDVFLLCAKACGIQVLEHNSTLVFEDSTHGLQAAQTAGMIPVGVTTQHDAETLRNAGAKLICKDLSEALAQGWADSIQPGSHF